MVAATAPLFGKVSETDRIQLERESLAYNAFQEAHKRGRKAEAILLWSEYARIHAQRPQAMVTRLENEKGLSKRNGPDDLG